MSADKRPGAMLVQLLLFCLGSIALYFPILGKSFASDDFLVMKRVGMDKVIWIKGFFRPLSDITLYGNYLLGGFDPWNYFFTNILLHGICAFLLYRLCKAWKWTEDEGRQGGYALLAALLFLCYPFHNECMPWGLGRAALSANLFGIAALLAVVSPLREGWRIFWCCLCYFIGMAGYESVMLLPLMVLVILYGRGTGLREYFRWGLALGLVLAANLVLRNLVAGTLVNEYGSSFFTGRLLVYVENLFKVAGRFFLPPMQDAWLMTMLTLLVVVVLGVVVWRWVRSAGSRPEERGYFFKVLLLFGIASAVPVFSGVSTHTSESDRFLYFPSYFLCAGVAFLLVGLAGRRRLVLTAVVLLCYECVFLEVNNSNWVKASRVTKEVLAAVVAAKSGLKGSGARLFVVNLPDEWNGAFIFRLGLPDALLINGVDTAGLVIVNHLTREEEVGLPDSLGVVEKGGGLEIGTGVAIERMGGGFGVETGGRPAAGPGTGFGTGPGMGFGLDSFRITGSGDAQTQPGWEKGRRYSWTGGKKDVILYWNRRRMVVLKGTGF